MPSLSEVEAHRRVLNDLEALAARDLVALWRSVDLSDAVEVREALADVLPTLSVAYSEASAALAAEWYDDLRASSSARGVYAAVMAEGLVERERVDALAGWAVGPLFGPSADAELALSRLSGGFQRIIANGDRLTIAENVVRDPSRARYARHASANACAFCALLASRGPVYSEETAARTRSGRKYHDNCRCAAVPVWDDDEYEPAPYVEQFREAYEKATRETGSTSVKQVTSSMRQTLGSH